MGRLRPRGELGLEKSSNEKAVIWKLHRAGFTQNSSRADAKSRGLKLFFVLLVHPVVAVVLLGVVSATANGMQPRSGNDLQPLVARRFGAAGGPIRQST